MANNPLTEKQKQALLKAAKLSILHGLAEGRPISVESSEIKQIEGIDEPVLWEERAAFVTLNKRQSLRGCIGSLQAYRPLIEDVVHHAFDAAFKDPRFPPLMLEEVDDLSVEISVLTPPKIMEACHTYQDLLEQLQPNEEGLILNDGVHQATFLPSVWEQLPDKQQFVLHLMQKAGMKSWSQNMRCYRYHTLKFAAEWQDIEV